MLQSESIFHSPFSSLSSSCIFHFPAGFVFGCRGYWSFITLTALDGLEGVILF